MEEKKKPQTTLILHDDIFFNESFYKLRKKKIQHKNPLSDRFSQTINGPTITG